MPAADPNKNNVSRAVVHALNKKRAKRVRKAREYLTQPVAKGSKPPVVTRAPEHQIEQGGAGATAAAAKNYSLDESKRLVKDKHRSLHKKERSVSELARLGVLPRGYLSGLQERAQQEQAVRDAETEKREEFQTKLHDLALKDPYPKPAADASEVEKLVYKHVTGDRAKHSAPTTLESAISGAPVGLARSAAALVEGVARDPYGVPSKTGKQALAAIPAAFTGVAELVQHPVKSTKAMVEDYAHRAGETYEEKLARIRKHGGFEDVSDLTMVTSGGTSAAAKAILLKGGERAAVRTAGHIVKPRRSSGVVRTAVGVALDKRRIAKLESDLVDAEAGGVPMDAVRHAAAVSNRKTGVASRAGDEFTPAESVSLDRAADALRAGMSDDELRHMSNNAARHVEANDDFVRKAGGDHESGGNGEALAAQWRGHREAARRALTGDRPSRSPKPTGGMQVVPRRAGHAQAQDVASRKGKAVYGLKHDQGARTAAATKTINRLDKNEKRALYYGEAFGIRTAAQARDLLGGPKGLAAAIVKQRYLDGTRVTGVLKKSDMLPDIAKILADPDAHFTAKLADVVEELRPDSIRAGREDPSLPNALTRVRRRYAPLVDRLGLVQGEKPHIDVHGVRTMRTFPETDREFSARAIAEVASRGLAKPLYFKSERYAGPTDFAARAVGGKKAMAHDRTYEGKNLSIGIQDTRPLQHVRGLARNIKRAHNWKLVASILDAHAIPGLAPRGGSTITHLRESVAARGIDEGSVAYWNPGIYQKSVARTASTPDDLFAVAEEEAQAGPVLASSVVHGNAATPDHLVNTHGWQVVPAATLKELEAQSVPSSAAARVWDIGKGKASRIILLAGNIPWAGFQVVQSAGGAAVATGGRALNPANWLGTARWWKALDEAERRNVGAHLGLDTSNADLHQVRLGASTNSSLVNAYRALKEHPAFHTGIIGGHGPTVSQLNPMELMGAFDRTQNNAFRKLTGYTLAKHETVKRMGTGMGRAEKAQQRVVSLLAMPAKDQLKALAREKPTLVEHAERVADWMGDYTTLTAFERKVLNRTIMFYPYMRYSLKLVFYTMPIKHPAVSALLAEIGAMHADEIRKLFGEDQLFWNLGKIYFGEKGDVKEIDLKKLNPVMNALFDAAGAKNPGQLMGVLPPFAGMLFDQLTHKSNFKDREWRVDGKAGEYGAKSKDYGGRVRARIIANSLLSLAYPYREIMKELHPETQGDDSLIVSPRPTKFKGKTTESKLKAKFAKREQAFNAKNKSWLTTLVPLVPTPSRDAEAAHEAEILKKAEAPSKKHKKSPYFGTSSGGSGPFGSKP